MKDYNRVGETFITNEGYKVTIIEYLSSTDCTIQFENNTVLKNRQYISLQKGSLKNPYHPSVYGVGFVGEGSHKSKINTVKTKSYKCWGRMLERCYSKKFLDKHRTYRGCSVDEKWHNFQIFGEWFEENYVDGWELDKDILFKGNKVYSLETCCFVPKEINLIFSIKPASLNTKKSKFVAQIAKNNKKKHLGVFPSKEEADIIYNKHKEEQIRQVAEKWRDFLKGGVYNNLINYKWMNF